MTEMASEQPIDSELWLQQCNELSETVKPSYVRSNEGRLVPVFVSSNPEALALNAIGRVLHPLPGKSFIN